MVVDQADARARITAAVTAATTTSGQPWRADRRAHALAVLHALSVAADWETGVSTGVTHARLAATAGVSTRTVSAIVAWAAKTGLIAIVETGASAQWFGLRHGRTPSYVVLRPLTSADALTCDPPAKAGQVRPVGGTHPRARGRDLREWPRRDRADGASERRRAADRALTDLGVPRSAHPRGRAMLAGWLAAGVCPAGLVHMTDEHPDHPGASRGGALRAARDPLAVLGSRLRPWRGRLAELPTEVRAVDPTAREARAADLDRRVEAAERAAPRVHVETAASGPGSARAAALAAARRPRRPSDTVGDRRTSTRPTTRTVREGAHRLSTWHVVRIP